MLADGLEGKVALVTGGTSGIGLATARLFVRAGVDVVLVGRDPGRGQAALEGFTGGPGRAIYVAADVRSADELTRAFAATDDTFGRLDILFNNAGAYAAGTVDEIDEATWDSVLETNLKSAYLASREAVPRMRARGGVIVNNASNAGLIARARDPAYCASKAGLVMLTRSMALAHAPDRIRVNAVCPGPVAGPLIERGIAAAADPEAERAATIAAAPLAAAAGRLIEPDEVAAAVLYLCSDHASMVTGAVIAVDAGKSSGIPR